MNCLTIGPVDFRKTCPHYCPVKVLLTARLYGDQRVIVREDGCKVGPARALVRVRRHRADEPSGAYVTCVWNDAMRVRVSSSCRGGACGLLGRGPLAERPRSRWEVRRGGIWPSGSAFPRAMASDYASFRGECETQRLDRFWKDAAATSPWEGSGAWGNVGRG